MRCLIALTLFATACTNVPVGGPRYDSVRERLTATPTSLYVRVETSSGAVTARRRGHDGWLDGTTQLAVEHGYLRAAIDDRSGKLAIQKLEVAVAPITLEGVFEKSAQLQDVRLRLAEPAYSEAAWTSDDDATATLVMTFDFDWAIAFDGGQPYPLATQHLPPQTVQVVLAGSGDHVDASLDVDATGELWNWADLVQLTDLSLSLTAETAD